VRWAAGAHTGRESSRRFTRADLLEPGPQARVVGSAAGEPDIDDVRIADVRREDRGLEADAPEQHDSGRGWAFNAQAWALVHLTSYDESTDSWQLT